MAWCYLLVLGAVSAVVSGQIIFGGSTSRGTDSGAGTSGPGTGSPGRVPISSSRGTAGTVTGTGASDRRCTSPEGLRGVCSPPAGCAAIKRRIQLEDADYLRRAFCERRNGELLMCCADSSQINSNPVNSFGPLSSPTRPIRTKPSTFSPQSPNPNPSRPSNLRPQPPRISSSNSPVFSSPSCPRFRSPSNCGRSPFTPSRVVNGFAVRSLGDFPWMAALKYTGQPRYKCGGAVIAARWVLTAGHCLLNDGPTEVVIGDLNLVTDTDDSTSYPPQTIPVQLTARHPDYRRSVRGNEKGFFDDIALIKVARQIQFSDVVKPICLDSSPKPILELERTEAIVAGWGATEFAGLSSPGMQWGKVEITPQQSCRATYAEQGYKVDGTQLCANGRNERGGVDTCHGDSGGPLMIQRSRSNVKRWYIAGIVSYGAGCGNPETPGVYTYTGAHLGWIGCTINGN